MLLAKRNFSYLIAIAFLTPTNYIALLVRTTGGRLRWQVPAAGVFCVLSNVLFHDRRSQQCADAVS
jgi:hypothetical protein